MMTLSLAWSTGSQEFFIIDDKIAHLTNGETVFIEDLTEQFKDLLQEELNRDLPAQKALIKLGITDPKEALNKFFHCNYSGFNSTPDITSCGKLGPREYIPCTERNICLAEGQLCKFPRQLTRREMQVASEVARGNPDKMICQDLNIDQNTLRNHKNNIEFKIQQKGKVAIAVFAIKYGLI